MGGSGDTILVASGNAGRGDGERSDVWRQIWRAGGQ